MCEDGQFYNSVSNPLFPCEDCLEGQNNPSFILNPYSCLDCDMGTYSTEKKSLLCTLCPKGTYSSVVGSKTEADCIKCPINTYSDTEGTQVECNSCPDPSFTLSEGQEACISNKIN